VDIVLKRTDRVTVNKHKSATAYSPQLRVCEDTGSGSDIANSLVLVLVAMMRTSADPADQVHETAFASQRVLDKRASVRNPVLILYFLVRLVLSVPATI